MLLVFSAIRKVGFNLLLMTMKMKETVKTENQLGTVTDLSVERIILEKLFVCVCVCVC